LGTLEGLGCSGAGGDTEGTGAGLGVEPGVGDGDVADRDLNSQVSSCSTTVTAFSRSAIIVRYKSI
jgi:hypothetical protein